MVVIDETGESVLSVSFLDHHLRGVWPRLIVCVAGVGTCRAS
jgi:hypothetical protein